MSIAFPSNEHAYLHRLLPVIVLLHGVDGLLDIAQYDIAVAVISLVTVSWNWQGCAATDMQTAFELAIAAELHEDDLVKREADEVEGF